MPDDRAAPPTPDERTYSGDLVLLVLFVILAVVVGGLFLLHAQVD
jgi:hypothetical protein